MRRLAKSLILNPSILLPVAKSCHRSPGVATADHHDFMDVALLCCHAGGSVGGWSSGWVKPAGQGLLAKFAERVRDLRQPPAPFGVGGLTPDLLERDLQRAGKGRGFDQCHLHRPDEKHGKDEKARVAPSPRKSQASAAARPSIKRNTSADSTHVINVSHVAAPTIAVPFCG